MVRLPPMLGVRDLLRLYKVRARKQLSQNFLLDPTIIGRFVSKAEPKGCHVVEVGPGPGSLTRALLACEPKSLVVVEKDDRFLPLLETLREAYPANERVLKIVQGDILEFDWERVEIPQEAARDWAIPELPPIRIIGNLPFSIATPLIIRWLHDISERRGPWRFGRVPMVLSFQEEVAQRMIAPRGAPHRCRLSVMCQSLCHVRYGMKIRGGSFVPAPDVNAGVVVLTPRVEPLVPFGELGFRFYERVVRDIFNTKNAPISRGIGNFFPKLLKRKIVPSVLGTAGLVAHPDAAKNQMAEAFANDDAVDAVTGVEDGAPYDEIPPATLLSPGEFGAIALAVKRWHEAVPQLAHYDYRSPKAARTDGEDLVDEVDSYLRRVQEEGQTLSSVGVGRRVEPVVAG